MGSQVGMDGRGISQLVAALFGGKRQNCRHGRAQRYSGDHHRRPKKTKGKILDMVDQEGWDELGVFFKTDANCRHGWASRKIDQEETQRQIEKRLKTEVSSEIHEADWKGGDCHQRA